MQNHTSSGKKDETKDTCLHAGLGLDSADAASKGVGLLTAKATFRPALAFGAFVTTCSRPENLRMAEAACLDQERLLDSLSTML